MRTLSLTFVDEYPAAGPPDSKSKVESTRIPEQPRRSREQPAQAAFRRFLGERLCGRRRLVGAPEFAARAQIDQNRLWKLMSEDQDARLSADEMFRCARAFDELDPGLGAALLTAMGVQHGYAVRRVGDPDADTAASAAAAGGNAAEVCRAVSPAGPGGEKIARREAPGVLERGDRAVSTMLGALALVRAKVSS